MAYSYENTNSILNQLVLNSLCATQCSLREFERIIKGLTTASILRRMDLLMCPRDATFNFGELLNNTKLSIADAEKALERVTSNAPDIETLTIYAENPRSSGEEPCPPPRKLSENIVKTIGKMRSLTCLDIQCNFYFKLESLLNLCREMRQLKEIYVKIAQEDIRIFKDVHLPTRFKESFGNLESFKFVPEHNPGSKQSVYDFQRDLTFYCIFHLHNLKQVGDCTEFKIDMALAIAKQTQRTQLEFLRFHVSEPLLFDVEKLHLFPAIKQLEIIFDDKFNYPPVITSLGMLRDLFKGCSKLTSLLLHCLHSSAYLEFILDVFGSNLAKLHVTLSISKLETIRLATIYNTCPQLQELLVENLHILDHDAAWSISSHCNLTTLVLYVIGSSENCSLRLIEILSATYMQNVILDGITVSEEDLVETINYIKNTNSVCQHLKYVHILLEAKENDVLNHSSGYVMDLKRALRDKVQSNVPVTISFKKLKHVK